MISIDPISYIKPSVIGFDKSNVNILTRGLCNKQLLRNRSYPRDA